MIAGSKIRAPAELVTGPVVWSALCDTGVDCEICDSVVSRSREKKLLKLMNECREKR